MSYINFAVNILKCGASAGDEHLEVAIVVSLMFARQYRHMTTKPVSSLDYIPHIYCTSDNHLFHCWSSANHKKQYSRTNPKGESI